MLLHVSFFLTFLHEKSRPHIYIYIYNKWQFTAYLEWPFMYILFFQCLFLLYMIVSLDESSCFGGSFFFYIYIWFWHFSWTWTQPMILPSLHLIIIIFFYTCLFWFLFFFFTFFFVQILPCIIAINVVCCQDFTAT